MTRFWVYFAIPLITALLFASLSRLVVSVVISQATPTTLLYADFTGAALPAGWLLQGAATFVGGLDASTGAGGIQLISGLNERGAVVYNLPLRNPNLVIEFSGMYGLGYFTCCGESPPGIADDLGAGFYADGPSANVGNRNPAAVSGYYAAYEFYGGSSPALMYNGGVLLSGARMQSSGVNYLLAQTIVIPSLVSMNTFSSTEGPLMVEPSISPTSILTYQGPISNSLSTFYVGAASASGGTDVYVYWVRVLSHPTTPLPPYPPLPIPEAGLSRSTSITSASTEWTTIPQATPQGGQIPNAGVTGSANLTTLISIGFLVIFVLVPMYAVMSSRWRRKRKSAGEMIEAAT